MNKERYEYLAIPKISIHSTEKLLKVEDQKQLLNQIWNVNARAFGKQPNEAHDYERWLAGNTHVMTLECNNEVVGAAEYTHRMVGIRPKGAILEDFEKNVLQKKWNRGQHGMKVGTSVLYLNTLYVDPQHTGKGHGVELQKKLIEYVNPAYTVIFSKNAQLIASQKKAAESNGMYTYVGGIPLGEYPLYFAVYELLEQISAQWYKDFNELFLFLDEPNSLRKVADKNMILRFQQGMWENRENGIGVKIIGFSRGGKTRNEPLRGEIVHPRENTLLADRLGKAFNVLDVWNSLKTYRSFTFPVVSIDPSRFPIHLPLGRFRSTEYSINPLNQLDPHFRDLVQIKE